MKDVYENKKKRVDQERVDLSTLYYLKYNLYVRRTLGKNLQRIFVKRKCECGRFASCKMLWSIVSIILKELELERLTRWSDITPKVEMWRVRTMTEGNVERIRGVYPVTQFDWMSVLV